MPMGYRRALALTLLGTIVIWATWICCGLASWQDISTHELFGYWPAWDPYQTLADAWNNTDILESNGILVMLFYKLLWSKLFSGMSLLGLRFPSILGNLGALVLIYLIGKEVSGRRVAILAAFLLATNTLQTSIAVHCRFFSHSTFFMLLSLWLLLRICRRPSWWLWALYAGAWIGALGTMVLNLLFVPGHIILYLACAPRGRDKFFSATAILLLCSSVFGALYLRDLGAVSRFNYPHSWPEWQTIGFAVVTQGYTWGNRLVQATLGNTFEIDKFIVWQAVGVSVLLFALFGYELVKVWRQRRCNLTLFAPLLPMSFALEWAVISLTIKPLTVVTNTAAMWPLVSLVLAQAVGGSGKLARVVRVLILMLLFNNAPLFSSNTFIHDRQTPQIANVFRTYFRPGDIAIIHNHQEIDPYWLIGFTARGTSGNYSDRLRTATRIAQGLSQGRKIAPKVLSATTENLSSLSALIYQNSRPGQRIWVVAHVGDSDPSRIYNYIRWYTGQDVKFLTKNTEGVFAMFFVK